MKTSTSKKRSFLSTNSAIKFVVILGIVSLFADVTYEGGRSLSGQYLKILGAGATAVGIAAGAGEFLGYSLRLVSGYIADRTGKYWFMIFLGYALNLLAIPCLALVGQWQLAVLLLFIERIGKATRNPARDAMLSHATTQMGRGWGFGLHEALDQIGALVGPLIVTLVLYFKNAGEASRSVYQTGFAVLLIPALLALTMLTIARYLYPRPSELASKTPVVGTKGFNRRYWWYVAGAGLVAFGFADFPLMAYHLKGEDIAADQWIPMFYALAMATDAIAALIFGRLFDRRGYPILLLAFSLSALFAPLVFLGSLPVILIGLGLWGIGMGAQESILRAGLADLAPQEKRATAYGMYHTGFGICWLLGSALMGFFYDHFLAGLIVVSITAQLAALAVFAGLYRTDRHPTPTQ